MATAIKVLGQAAALANTWTTVYTVPAATTTIVSTLYLCNGVNSTNFDLKIAVNGAVDDRKQYLLSQKQVDPGDPYPLTIGVTLGAGDIIWYRANQTDTSCSAFGTEIT